VLCDQVRTAIAATGFTLVLTLAWPSGLSLPEPAFHSHEHRALRRVYFLLTEAADLTIRERKKNCGTAIQVYVPVSFTRCESLTVYPEAHSV
jgi:hypothetical protein